MDTGSLARYTLDLEFASKASDALLHGMESQVTWEGSGCIKPFAIITYLKDDILARKVQSQFYLTRPSMLDRIMHGLLRDSVGALLDLEREIRLGAQISVHCYILPRMQSHCLFELKHALMHLF